MVGTGEVGGKVRSKFQYLVKGDRISKANNLLLAKFGKSQLVAWRAGGAPLLALKKTQETDGEIPARTCFSDEAQLQGKGGKDSEPTSKLDVHDAVSRSL